MWTVPGASCQPAPGPRPVTRALHRRLVTGRTRRGEVRAVARLGGRALTRSEQITGRERDRLGRLLAERYQAGATIRELAGQTGRSYAWVRALLVEADVELRGRGGDQRHRNREPGR